MESQEQEQMGIMSASSLLRTVGRIGAPSGRGLLMFRSLAIASTGAAVTGVCGAFIGGITGSGGHYFFLIGSCIGYVMSSVYFFRNQMDQAFDAFLNYPQLMRLHMVMNFPLMRFHRMDLRPEFILAERARLASTWQLTSMLIASYQTARTSIDDIMQRREQILVAELSQEAVLRPEDSEEALDHTNEEYKT